MIKNHQSRSDEVLTQKRTLFLTPPNQTAMWFTIQQRREELLVIVMAMGSHKIWIKEIEKLKKYTEQRTGVVNMWAVQITFLPVILRALISKGT